MSASSRRACQCSARKESLRSSVQTAGCTTSTANGFALWSVPNTRWTPSVAMHDVNAFEDTVSAYPAITVLRNGRQGRAHVVEAIDGFDAADGRTVTQWLADGHEVASANSTGGCDRSAMMAGC